MILSGRTVLAAFLVIAPAACEKQQDKNSAQLSKPATPPISNAPDPTMHQPTAIILAWVGPSDRPSPPIVLWSEDAALKSSTDWLAKRGLAPIGVTAVESKSDALACVAKSISAPSSGRNLVEVTAWRNGAAPTPIVMDAAAAISFLDASRGCVDSHAAGYLESLKTLVKNSGG